MDSEMRAAFEQTHAAIAGIRTDTQEAIAGIRTDTQEAIAGIRTDTQEAIAEVRIETRAVLAETRAGFARIDHLLELNQSQHMETRLEISGLREDVTGLRSEFRQFRNWATAQFVEVRSAILQLNRGTE